MSIVGMTMNAVNRQTASSMMVNKILDFSSGILKQLPSVLRMERNIISGIAYGLAGAAFLAALLAALSAVFLAAFETVISTEPPLASILVLAEALMALTTKVSFLV